MPLQLNLKKMDEEVIRQELIKKALEDLNGLQLLVSRIVHEEQAVIPHIIPLSAATEPATAVTNGSVQEKKRLADLGLHNDILKAEVKALRAKDESSVVQLRQHEKQAEQQAVNLQRQQEKMKALEAEKQSMHGQVMKQVGGFNKVMQQLSADKDALRQMLNKLLVAQAGREDAYILKEDYDKCQHVVKEQHNALLCSQSKASSLESALTSSANTIASLQHQLLQSQQHVEHYQHHLQACQQELSAVQASLQRTKAELGDEQRRANKATELAKAAEQSTVESQLQLTAAVRLQKQTLQKVEEQEKELAALAAEHAACLAKAAAAPAVNVVAMDAMTQTDSLPVGIAVVEDAAAFTPTATAGSAQPAATAAAGKRR